MFQSLRVLNVSNSSLSGPIPEALQSSGMFHLVGAHSQGDLPAGSSADLCSHSTSMEENIPF